MMMHRIEKMDVKNLITFIHVAERNSFTKAARALGYSQSTVSFQIKHVTHKPFNGGLLVSRMEISTPFHCFKPLGFC